MSCLTAENLLFRKRKYLSGLILPVFISVICVAFSRCGESEAHDKWKDNRIDRN